MMTKVFMNVLAGYVTTLTSQQHIEGFANAMALIMMMLETIKYIRHKMQFVFVY